MVCLKYFPVYRWSRRSATGAAACWGWSWPRRWPESWPRSRGTFPPGSWTRTWHKVTPSQKWCCKKCVWSSTILLWNMYNELWKQLSRLQTRKVSVNVLIRNSGHGWGQEEATSTQRKVLLFRRANFELWRQMWGTGLQDNGITSNRLSNKKLSWTIEKYIGVMLPVWFRCI